ncbi:thermonuclease family protein [Chroogloeocystis siderophila]|jgi:endonuclease YncB( thermonuclease family)|uniref:Nuclease n=1 Tax=Chroogloeocystis siderophila 5.2 s.c.1 TaxID=247279 RepID=A0A1U7HJG8_9CHRO|nr:thermonuclease family protein [Chroogloeocystis siderophila]OKH23685.1 nuclease [Chroogloeocystis siderophila 5.2 s.c.1]
MSAPFYRVIKGKFVIKGKEPDGDSVRFIADNPDLYEELHRSYRIELSRDRSVQLRFEGIDAPEVHYGRDAQILGDKTRDCLLEGMGFKNIVFLGNRVESANPDSVPGAILSKAADANGRPVSYIFLEEDTKQLDDADWIRVEEKQLEKTINHQMLQDGNAYYTVYTSTPLTHRESLRKAATKAKADQLGVWAEDVTNQFELEDKTSITTPNGQLILPKLFRRSIDYLKAVDKGFEGNLKDWLISISSGSRNENDSVVVGNSMELKLSDLIKQRNNKIVFQADLLDITFVEK